MPDWPFDLDDPYPGYHAARAAAPVQFHDGVGAHLVLSYEHADAVLRGAEFSSDPRNDARLLARLGAENTELWARSLLFSDPPEHTRLRSAVNRFFTPRTIERIRASVGTIVDCALEPLAEGEPVEVMGDFAYPVPVAVIAELFDIGVEGAQLLRDETPALARMLEPDPTPEALEQAASAAMTLMLFLVPLVAERRTDPGEDLLSALLCADAALADDEVISLCLLLLAAGHETTANLIGNGLHALLAHPEQLARLLASPQDAGRAVEELLRFDSPAQVARRAALHDVRLGDAHIHQGDELLVLIGAANRDPARYADPDRLDIDRDGPPHLAFGHGIHFCVGVGLARLEGEETFRRLAQLPLAWDALHATAQRDPSPTFRRLRSLSLAAGAAVPLVEPPADQGGASARLTASCHTASSCPVYWA